MSLASPAHCSFRKLLVAGLRQALALDAWLSGGHIDIQAQRADDRIKICVHDNGDGLVPGWSEGVGLANTRRRLLNSCPDATVDLLDTTPGCLATLTLPSP